MKNVLIITIFFVVLLLVGCGSNYQKLEKELESKARDYYTNNIDGKVIGIKNHKITLESLEKSDISIKNFINKKCSKDSYAIVTVDDNQQIKVKNYLTCGDYTTKN